MCDIPARRLRPKHRNAARVCSSGYLELRRLQPPPVDDQHHLDLARPIDHRAVIHPPPTMRGKRIPPVQRTSPLDRGRSQRRARRRCLTRQQRLTSEARRRRSRLRLLLQLRPYTPASRQHRRPDRYPRRPDRSRGGADPTTTKWRRVNCRRRARSPSRTRRRSRRIDELRLRRPGRGAKSRRRLCLLGELLPPPSSRPRPSATNPQRRESRRRRSYLQARPSARRRRCHRPLVTRLRSGSNRPLLRRYQQPTTRRRSTR